MWGAEGKKGNLFNDESLSSNVISQEKQEVQLLGKR